MSRYNTIGKTATHLYREGDTLRVRYHHTDVVTVTGAQIILNTGGWYTKTTKLRMNQAAWQLGLGYGISQRKGAWYVSRWNDKTKAWYDETPFDPSGIHHLPRNGGRVQP